jgi:hypothetical protein
MLMHILVPTVCVDTYPFVFSVSKIYQLFFITNLTEINQLFLVLLPDKCLLYVRTYLKISRPA